MDLVKIKDHQELRKDPNTGALLLVDDRKKQDYLSRKQSFANDAAMGNEINNLKESVSGMKTDIEQIKLMLQQIIRTNA